MQPKVKRHKAAKRDSTRFIDLYLNEIVDYGGMPCTRAEAILDMQRIGSTQGEIDRWLQGHELAQRFRQERLQTVRPDDNLPTTGSNS